MISRRSRSIVGVIIMAALLILYFVFVGVRAVALISSGTVVAVAMGIALIVLPLIGVWALWRELQFGLRSTALVDRLNREGLLPDDLGLAGPTGKPDRAVADAAFDRYRRETEADPTGWRPRMRLGIVYDACGDRARARKAIRTAILLERNEISRESGDN